MPDSDIVTDSDIVLDSDIAPDSDIGGRLEQVMQRRRLPPPPPPRINIYGNDRSFCLLHIIIYGVGRIRIKILKTVQLFRPFRARQWPPS